MGRVVTKPLRASTLALCQQRATRAFDLSLSATANNSRFEAKQWQQIATARYKRARTGYAESHGLDVEVGT